MLKAIKEKFAAALRALKDAFDTTAVIIVSTAAGRTVSRSVFTAAAALSVASVFNPAFTAAALAMVSVWAVLFVVRVYGVYTLETATLQMYEEFAAA